MKGRIFLIVAIVLGLVDVLVPYLLLAHVQSFAASFLFWCALTLLVIILAGIYTRRWRKSP
jgi:hypothetical protein